MFEAVNFLLVTWETQGERGVWHVQSAQSFLCGHDITKHPSQIGVHFRPANILPSQSWSSTWYKNRNILRFRWVTCTSRRCLYQILKSIVLMLSKPSSIREGMNPSTFTRFCLDCHWSACLATSEGYHWVCMGWACLPSNFFCETQRQLRLMSCCIWIKTWQFICKQVGTELGQAQLKLGLDFTLIFCTIKICPAMVEISPKT